MKKSVTLIFILMYTFSKACDACKLQQPKITQNITHGTGPESQWDWLIVFLVTAITILTLFYSVKFLVKPEEKKKSHIKKTVLNF